MSASLATPTPTPTKTPAAAQRQFVFADVGELKLAVPLESVLGAVVWPALSRLPRRAGALCGVFQYFGQAIGLLDLALWLDIGAARQHCTPYHRALILRQDGRRVAIGVDHLSGLLTLPSAAVERISHDDDGQELFHSTLRRPHGEGLASLLDVGRLLTLAQTWSAEGDGSANEAVETSTAEQGALRQRLAFGVVAGTGCKIGFAVVDLAEVVPAPPLQRFYSPLTEGLCRWRDRHLPVTSLAKCFPGLAPAPVAAAPLMAVFERDGRALGMLIDRVPEIMWLALPDDAAMQAHAADGTVVHLIGGAALHARFPETVLSQHAAQIEAPSASGSPRNQSSLLVYEAGGCAATPLDGIEAVLRLPQLAAGASHMPWRDGVMALRDLRSSKDGDGTVIVIRDSKPQLGVIVDAVRTIVPAHAGRLARIAIAGSAPTELLTIGAGSDQMTYTIRDLRQRIDDAGTSP